MNETRKKAQQLTIFGDALRQKREALGLGLRDCAKQLGVSATYLCRVEKGGDPRAPTEARVRRLAEILEADPVELLALAGRVSVSDLQAEIARLRGFARVILAGYLPGPCEIGDVDGGTIQDAAVAAGLLVPVPVLKRCGEVCQCAEYGFPVTCHRASATLQE